jgi:hypothetical protein
MECSVPEPDKIRDCPGTYGTVPNNTGLSLGTVPYLSGFDSIHSTPSAERTSEVPSRTFVRSWNDWNLLK